ncbi:ABC transporter permease [Rhodococcus sp. JS3073]|uniref:ABC transporter permease n=1 Tax=Rhodococcus sp. JS3073 TaxID=3002901 RepID=UPI00228600C2|nr:ABC transporter permease [Rhodococcus sp. JS3073]WAM19054.1 ABC transporter permease [Rhodococcus sp. JS3073]
MLDIIQVGAQIGLLYAPLALGIYIAIGVMSLPDLTLQGSFGIGGAITAQSIVSGLSPVLSLALGAVGGALAGLATALLHLRLRLNVLIAGLVMTTAAYSICLIIMNSGNITLLGQDTIFTWAHDLGLSSSTALLLMGLLITAMITLGLNWFLKTEYGLSLRATGENIQTARGLGIRTEQRQKVGLMIANGLAGVSGGLVVQQQGFMDVSIQNGIIVIGLAAVMIGRSIVHSSRVLPTLISVVLGILVYRIVVSAALDLGLNANYLQALVALIVIVIIAARVNLHRFKKAGSGSRRSRQAEQNQFYEEDRVASLI